MTVRWKENYTIFFTSFFKTSGICLDHKHMNVLLPKQFNYRAGRKLNIRHNFLHHSKQIFFLNLTRFPFHSRERKKNTHTIMLPPPSSVFSLIHGKLQIGLSWLTFTNESLAATQPLKAQSAQCVINIYPVNKFFHLSYRCLQLLHNQSESLVSVSNYCCLWPSFHFMMISESMR